VTFPKIEQFFVRPEFLRAWAASNSWYPSATLAKMSTTSKYSPATRIESRISSHKW
jgi:hypothetical protein